MKRLVVPEIDAIRSIAALQDKRHLSGRVVLPGEADRSSLLPQHSQVAGRVRRGLPRTWASPISPGLCAPILSNGRFVTWPLQLLPGGLIASAEKFLHRDHHIIPGPVSRIGHTAPWKGVPLQVFPDQRVEAVQARRELLGMEVALEQLLRAFTVESKKLLIGLYSLHQGSRGAEDRPGRVPAIDHRNPPEGPIGKADIEVPGQVAPAPGRGLTVKIVVVRAQSRVLIKGAGEQQHAHLPGKGIHIEDPSKPRREVLVRGVSDLPDEAHEIGHLHDRLSRLDLEGLGVDQRVISNVPQVSPWPSRVHLEKRAVGIIKAV